MLDTQERIYCRSGLNECVSEMQWGIVNRLYTVQFRCEDHYCPYLTAILPSCKNC